MIGICYWGLVVSLLASAQALDENLFHKINECDIVIAGGSLAAAAAAISVANITRFQMSDIRTCLLEPTDWPGGQLTSSNVPPDFGEQNQVAVNLPASFVELLIEATGDWESNPGACWVSTKCFNAERATVALKGLLDRMKPELTVFYNTVIVSSERNPDGRVDSITATSRTPIDGTSGWERSLSNDLLDWYSLEDSDHFKKQNMFFSNFDVVLEASEFGDILMTSGTEAEVAQGMETPLEDSFDLITSCGQSFVFPFYMEYSWLKLTDEDLAKIPVGSCGLIACSLQGLNWEQVWSYRRSLAVGDDADMETFAQGEISNQNLDNDNPSGYLFNSLSDAMATARSGRWAGGINLTSVANAEERAYGWFQYMRATAPSEVQPFLNLSRSHTGTAHGLAKVPYLRDSRRSRAGLDGFRLTYGDVSYSNPADGGATARHFEDTVGIGMYLYADIHTLSDGVCTGGNAYPEYVSGHHPLNPYYIPFRALTVASAPNLLVAGKSMAQTFLATAATRLHPSEYSSGVAAGAAAWLMVTHNLSTAELYASKISDLQELLTSDSVRSPLSWTLPATKTSATAASKAATKAASAPPLPMQAVWLPIQYNCTTSDDVTRTVRSLKLQGVTRIYVDVWNNGVTYFNSSTMREIAGRSSMGQDVLLWTLTAANELGIEVVAWFEYGIMCSYGTLENNFAKTASQRGWVLGQADNFYWMDGRNDEVVDFVGRILMDAQREYGPLGLVGVQLDDHFAFPVSLGGTVGEMNAIMKALHDKFKTAYPRAIFSLSPATIDVAKSTYAIDWPDWADKGYFDEVVPQIYRTTFSTYKSEFDYTLRILSSQAQQRWVAAGVRCDGSGSPTPWDDLKQMLSYSTAHGRGNSVWYAHGVLELYPVEFKSVWN